MPAWLQVFQVLATLATVAIAFLAATIACGQWITARQRVVMDLFARRMEMYDELRKVVGDMVNSGSVRGEDLIAFMRAMDRADILFGPEVYAYLTELKQVIGRTRHAEVTLSHLRSREGLPNPSEAQIQEATGREADAEAAGLQQIITDFYVKFPKLIEPYVAMRQRNPRLPWRR